MHQCQCGEKWISVLCIVHETGCSVFVFLACDPKQRYAGWSCGMSPHRTQKHPNYTRFPEQCADSHARSAGLFGISMSFMLALWCHHFTQDLTPIRVPRCASKFFIYIFCMHLLLFFTIMLLQNLEPLCVLRFPCRNPWRFLEVQCRSVFLSEKSFFGNEAILITQRTLKEPLKNPWISQDPSTKVSKINSNRNIWIWSEF